MRKGWGGGLLVKLNWLKTNQSHIWCFRFVLCLDSDTNLIFESEGDDNEDDLNDNDDNQDDEVLKQASIVD